MVRKKLRKIRIEDLQIQDIKISFKFIISAVLLILVLLFLLDMLIIIPERPGEGVEGSKTELKPTFFSSEGSTRISMYLPAVDAEGKGVNTLLIVEATSGTGRTLTDIDNLLFWADTQHSIRIARRVAENITGRKEKDYNLVYTIEANASVIGGPSAGSALTIATIAALESRELKEGVLITGSVNHDGSIGPVSAIFEKAKAAKDGGASLFLVPLLQSRDVIYETTEHCEIFGESQICTTETRPRKIEVEEEAGIEVIEISSVQEAMDYFFE